MGDGEGEAPRRSGPAGGGRASPEPRRRNPPPPPPYPAATPRRLRAAPGDAIRGPRGGAAPGCRWGWPRQGSRTRAAAADPEAAERRRKPSWYGRRREPAREGRSATGLRWNGSTGLSGSGAGGQSAPSPSLRLSRELGRHVGLGAVLPWHCPVVKRTE